MKCLRNRWVFVLNPDTSKETVQFVHEVHPVFAVTLSTFYHILCVWNDDTMPSFNLFRVHLYCFSISTSLSAKKNHAWKIANEVRKGSNFRMRLWMVHIECTKRLGLKEVKKWNAFVTVDFWFQTLILLRRWSSLCTKCIQFLPSPSQLLRTCYVGEIMIPCQVSTFSKFICSAFQFEDHSAQKKIKYVKNSKWS